MKCNLRQNKQQTTPDLLLDMAAVALFFTSVIERYKRMGNGLTWIPVILPRFLGADLGNVQSLGGNCPADEEHATIKYSVLAG